MLNRKKCSYTEPSVPPAPQKRNIYLDKVAFACLTSRHFVYISTVYTCSNYSAVIEVSNLKRFFNDLETQRIWQTLVDCEIMLSIFNHIMNVPEWNVKYIPSLFSTSDIGPVQIKTQRESIDFDPTNWLNWRHIKLANLSLISQSVT